MGAWGNLATNVVATNADTYVVSTENATSASNTTWPHQDGRTTYYTRRVEPDWAAADALARLLDEWKRRLAKVAADWRVLHELLARQDRRRVKSRPPPRGVPPEDPVRSRRRPAPRAPPQNQTPGLIDRPGVFASTQRPGGRSASVAASARARPSDAHPCPGLRRAPTQSRRRRPSTRSRRREEVGLLGQGRPCFTSWAWQYQPPPSAAGLLVEAWDHTSRDLGPAAATPAAGVPAVESHDRRLVATATATQGGSRLDRLFPRLLQIELAHRILLCRRGIPTSETKDSGRLWREPRRKLRRGHAHVKRGSR